MSSVSSSLEPFSAADWPTAKAMLLAGYPTTPSKLWDAGFKRILEVPPGPSDAPIGMLLRQGSAVLGVLLLIPGHHARRDSGPRRFNASSWAIAPEARNRAMWMMRHSLPDPNTVYTALTPITSVTRMLQRVGFKAISHQAILGFTPRLRRLPHTGARMLKESEALAALAADPMAPALIDHQRLGCLVCALDTGDTLIPLVFRTRWRWRWLPTAEIMYTPSQATVATHIGAIARHLLSRGYPFVEFEANEDLAVQFPCTRLYQRRFARGPYDMNGIDHLYSELIYLHR